MTVFYTTDYPDIHTVVSAHVETVCLLSNRKCDTYHDHTFVDLHHGKLLIRLNTQLPKVADNASPGQKLRYYRLLNNLSQEELGRAVGCTLQGIVNYEKGFLDLYYENAVKFAEIFGVHPEIFMDEYTRFCKPGYGERIRIIRNLYGLSQQEFADQIVCSRATVSVWEAEIKDHHPERAAFEKIRQLAEAAGVNMVLLLKNPDLYTDEYTVFIKNDCGRKIRQIRLSHGLIQEDFARMIGCNTQNWLIGKPALQDLSDPILRD